MWSIYLSKHVEQKKRSCRLCNWFQRFSIPREKSVIWSIKNHYFASISHLANAKKPNWILSLPRMGRTVNTNSQWEARKKYTEQRKEGGERSVGRWKCNNKHYLSARGSLTMRIRREAARLVAKRKFFAIKSFRAVWVMGNSCGAPGPLRSSWLVRVRSID